MTLGIVELADVCTRMRALNLDLFTELGRWANAAPAGAAQRWYTTACHRHAWHAELWSERSPVIPDHDLDHATSAHRTTRLPERPDTSVYREQLGRLTTDLDTIGDRIDEDLDPSTLRTLTLIRNDVRELTSYPT